MNDNTMLEEKQLQGFGGWFVLVLIGLFANTILGVVEFIQYYEVWSFVDFGLGTILAISQLNKVLFSLIILIFIFRKDIRFRTLYLIQTCIVAVMTVCLFVFIGVDGQMIGALVGRILWTVYLYKSERVKNTFINKKQTEESHDLSAM